MGLIRILILFSFCFLIAAVPLPIVHGDCDDKYVFEAVDEALKTYNHERKDSKQFVLHRITDIKIKNGGDQKHYFVEYEIHEGSCDPKTVKTWQECQFQEYDPDRGKCSAYLLLNKENNLWTFVSQNCNTSKVPVESPVTAVHHQCLGCPQPIDTNNEKIQQIVHATIDQLNKEGSHLYYFDLEKIVNATRQVVSGWDYNIHYFVRQTNCSKNSIRSKNECKLDNNGESGECIIQVSETPEGVLNELLFSCTSETGVCLTCPLKVDPGDPELLILLNQVVDEYNSNSNNSQLYRFSSIKEATKKGFQVYIYDVLFTMNPTNCSKPEYTMLGEECSIIANSFALSCDVTINVTEKRMTFHSAPECVQLSKALRRISGLSPLRHSRQGKLSQMDNNLMLLDPIHKKQKIKHEKKGQTKGQSPEEKKKKETKHNGHSKHDSNEDSSEEVAESTDKVTHHAAPDLQNAESNQGSLIDLKELLIVTIPIAPTAQNCPGKLWQPTKFSSTVKTFTLDDLALALDDFQPEKVELSEPHVPKQIADFSDDDLLS